MLINAEGEVITVYVADIADFQFVAASVFKREVAGWKRLLFISGTGDDADAVYIDFDGIVCCKGERPVILSASVKSCVCGTSVVFIRTEYPLKESFL